MIEHWRLVPGFECIYEISDMGRVKRVGWSTTNHGASVILKQESSKLGYKRITLWLNGTPKRFQVHRLVMLAFVGPSNLSVNHKNGDPSDNRLLNLEYMTQRDNLKDSWARSPRIGLNQGSSHGMHKLTEGCVREIRRRRDAGESIGRLATDYGICLASVSMIANRKTWQHVT